MAVEHTSYFTIHCDVPDCKDRVTCAIPDAFWNMGWESIHVFDEEVCLCPDHAEELKGFLFK